MATYAYSEYENLKRKLRIPDDTLREELMLYQQEVDDLVNNKIRDRIGYYDSNGDEIVLPLTATTRPALDEELKAIAIDLVEGKFHLHISEKPLKWDTAVKSLENYLDRTFGIASHKPYQQKFTLTVTPRTGAVGATVTLSGTSWSKYNEVKIYMSGFEVATTPAQVLTDANGDFSSVTFTVPTSLASGTQTIKATDGLQGIEVRFTVTA